MGKEDISGTSILIIIILIIFSIGVLYLFIFSLFGIFNSYYNKYHEINDGCKIIDSYGFNKEIIVQYNCIYNSRKTEIYHIEDFKIGDCSPGIIEKETYISYFDGKQEYYKESIDILCPESYIYHLENGKNN